MGKLAGFGYRKIVKSLKSFGFSFDRQASGSHEIWHNAKKNRYTTIPNYPGRFRNVLLFDFRFCVCHIEILPKI
ncbi:MAG: type II toxin-antitoxin system HicA family toxin [Nitrospirota bacterium]|nr:type II toxin-antitoxin system HicA family toxin [Nitrospirota bacterium]